MRSTCVTCTATGIVNGEATARTPRRGPAPARRPMAGRAPSRAGAAAALPPGPVHPARPTRATVAVHDPTRHTPGRTRQGHGQGPSRGPGQGRDHLQDTAGHGHHGALEAVMDAGGQDQRVPTDAAHEVEATGRAPGLPAEPHGAHGITTTVAATGAAVHIAAPAPLAHPDPITTTHYRRLCRTTWGLRLTATEAAHHRFVQLDVASMVGHLAATHTTPATRTIPQSTWCHRLSLTAVVGTIIRRITFVTVSPVPIVATLLATLQGHYLPHHTEAMAVVVIVTRASYRPAPWGCLPERIPAIPGAGEKGLEITCPHLKWVQSDLPREAGRVGPASVTGMRMPSRRPWLC